MDTSNYEIKFFAWCNEGTSDKIWGYVEFKNSSEQRDTLIGSMYNFWGGRGKTLKFKRHYGLYDQFALRNLAHKKLYPGPGKDAYKEINIRDIDTVCPGFKEYFQNQLMEAKWGDKIKNDDLVNQTFL